MSTSHSDGFNAQESLFLDLPTPSTTASPTPAPLPQSATTRPARGLVGVVQPTPPSPELQALAGDLPSQLFLGTSSWHFPGWERLVWDRAYPAPALSKNGLTAYAQHPLLRSVSLDRAFYRPLTVSQYAAYAAQVPEHFRFIVKGPSLVCDALMRDESGRGMKSNPAFLDSALAIDTFVRPAIEGLGDRLGALVFQLSPLPPRMLDVMDLQLERLSALLLSLAPLRASAPGVIVAVEVRNAEWLGPALVHVLRNAGATYCLGLHPRLPPIEAQLPMLRALWPGPLVCRWNLNRQHGAQGYEQAKSSYEPFNQLIDPDPHTRNVLARVIAGTTSAGHPALVCINNKAEGSAPLSVQALAQAVKEQIRKA